MDLRSKRLDVAVSEIVTNDQHKIRLLGLHPRIQVRRQTTNNGWHQDKLNDSFLHLARLLALAGGDRFLAAWLAERRPHWLSGKPAQNDRDADFIAPGWPFLGVSLKAQKTTRRIGGLRPMGHLT